MNRYMIVIPAKNRSFVLKCDELLGFTKHVADTICSEWL